MGVYIDKISGEPFIFDIAVGSSNISGIIQSVTNLSGNTDLDFENQYYKVWDTDISSGFTAVTYSNFNVGASGLLSIRKTIASNIDIVFPSGTISNAGGLVWDSATRTLTISGIINSFHEITINQTRSGIYKITYSGEFE